MDFAIEITPIIPCIGVVFPFKGLLSFLFLGNFEENISVAIKSGARTYPSRVRDTVTTSAV